MRPVSIVVLAKYKEILEPFLLSMQKFIIPEFTSENTIVFVLDGNEIDPSICAGPFSHVIKGPEQFSMAGNGNLGLKAVPSNHDILYCGDDIRFLEPKSIERLQEIAYSDEKIGIVSPRIIGRGSPSLLNPQGEINEVRPLEMWFPCVYIKRQLIDNIGYLDEDFSNFGSDDLDFCVRTKMAGYKLVSTNKVTVKHESSPEGGPTTFCKNIGVDSYRNQEHESYRKLEKKWGVSDIAFAKFMTTGDVKFLNPVKKDGLPRTIDISNMDSPPTKEEVEEFLKSRYIHLATPCYGGMMTVNYTNSLLSLVNICNQMNIKMDVSFMYNESLITRARNEMVSDARMKRNFTDFLFIDADINYDARDIISLLLYDKDVIGAPCVRKNLRLDRIVQAAQKNGRSYSQDELEILTGEYVVNWPEGGMPATIKLDRLIEVQDVGTGIMKIKKETFDKVEKFFPDRWFMPLKKNKIESVSPQFMFFQSELDMESAEHNPGGIPNYIPEDYSFCHLVRKAGMKIWLAPWMKTGHAGTHVFRGDLPAICAAGGSLR